VGSLLVGKVAAANLAAAGDAARVLLSRKRGRMSRAVRAPEPRSVRRLEFA
jgi:hypothetical protein